MGKAITLALAQAGANVVVNYHSSAGPAEETAAEARSLGARALPVRADVADPEQVKAMVDAAHERFGALDILVNGASLWKATPFPMEDLTEEVRELRARDVIVLTDACHSAAVSGEQATRGDTNVINQRFLAQMNASR